MNGLFSLFLVYKIKSIHNIISGKKADRRKICFSFYRMRNNSKQVFDLTQNT